MKKKQSFYYFYGKKSLLKIMRLLFILMAMTSMTISANSFSQQQRVTLDVKNVGAMELFKEIQKETNLYFVYNDADLISYNKISVSAKDENVDVLLEQTKEKTIKFLKLHLEEQALLFTKKRCQNTINNVCNQSTQTIDDYKTSLDEIVDKVKPQEEYSKACKELQKIVDDKDYLAALRVINNKGLLPFTNVSNAFGWKKQNYIDYVIRLLGIQDSTSEELCNIFGNYVTVGD